MRAAFYEKDITPPLGCYLAGYFINHVGEDVLDPLYVRSAVVESNGTVVAFADIDSCEFPDDMHEAVTKRIFEYTGIPAEQVMLAVNHTHKGIPITDNPEIGAYADAAFKDVVYRLIADSVILAYKRLQPTEGVFGVGRAEGISFNRTYVMKDGTYRTNVWGEDVVRPLGGIDEDVPIVFFKDNTGKPQGALVSFACHQDCTPGSQYSGAFAYVLSEEMKKEYGRDFVTVFMAGTSGDINHFDPKRHGNMPDDTYIKMGKILKKACTDAICKAEPIGEGIISRKTLFCVPRRVLSEDEAFSETKRMADEKNMIAVRNLCYYRACVHEDTMQVYLQYVKLGNVSVYAFPGEIFVYFGRYIKEHAKTAKNMVVSFTNHGCGYVATREAFAPNSRLYERDLCVGACLAPDAGYMMADKLLAMAEDA